MVISMKQIVVAMTGASGSIFALRLLEHLHRRSDVQTHLIISRWARTTAAHAMGMEEDQAQAALAALADFFYDDGDMTAPVASGSFRHDGMIVIPCSMKTLGAIAWGISETLIPRAADVTIKERRPLVLVTRETPLSPIHLENMLRLSRIGVTIMPPVLGLYSGEKTIEEAADTFAGRALEQLGIENDLYRPWAGVAR